MIFECLGLAVRGRGFLCWGARVLPMGWAGRAAGGTAGAPSPLMAALPLGQLAALGPNAALLPASLCKAHWKRRDHLC